MIFRDHCKRVARPIVHLPAKTGSFIRRNLCRMARQFFSAPLIFDRDELPILLKFLGLHNEGAEIGVFLGDFSEHLLNGGVLSKLYSIDPWKNFDAAIYSDVDNIAQSEFDRVYGTVVERLKKFGTRSEIVRATSREAAERFKDGSLDFIYIDANHSYLACKEDLDIWWHKVRSGGVFAGHDYVNSITPSGSYEVKRAVDEFVSARGERLYTTCEKDWPTWYLIKSRAS